ncbi:hypothetical protein ATY79_23785 [Rhizobium sp. R693]|nr:hypothetical protein ATY79_23785 [Rhizobium sp. R693]
MVQAIVGGVSRSERTAKSPQLLRKASSGCLNSSAVGQEKALAGIPAVFGKSGRASDPIEL